MNHGHTEYGTMTRPMPPPMDRPTTTLGPRQPETSVAQHAQMLFNQSEGVLGRLANILARIDHIPTGKNDGAVPEMPIGVKLQVSFENLCKMESLLGQLEMKIFG